MVGEVGRVPVLRVASPPVPEPWLVPPSCRLGVAPAGTPNKVASRPAQFSSASPLGGTINGRARPTTVASLPDHSATGAEGLGAGVPTNVASLPVHSAAEAADGEAETGAAPTMVCSAPRQASSAVVGARGAAGTGFGVPTRVASAPVQTRVSSWAAEGAAGAGAPIIVRSFPIQAASAPLGR